MLAVVLPAALVCASCMYQMMFVRSTAASRHTLAVLVLIQTVEQYVKQLTFAERLRSLNQILLWQKEPHSMYYGLRSQG